MKEELLLKILEISQLEQTAIQQEDMTKLNELMEDKQVYIDQIAKLREEGYDLKTEDNQILLNRIQEIDEANNIELTQRMNNAKERLANIRKKKSIDVRYSNPYHFAYDQGVYFDKKDSK